ncbi:MAG TPA: AraC family transcriptional regulator [Mycobacterium sp.]|nr:AraC family transcriptional regulator [Mycobacterium sp.]
MDHEQFRPSEDDVLASLLDVHRLSTVVVGRIDLESPWRLDGVPTDLLVIQVQVAGQSHVTFRSAADTVVLNPGDVAIYPHGVSDSYLHDGSNPVRATTKLTVPSAHPRTTPEPLHLTKGPADTSIIVGLMSIDHAPRSALWSALPTVMTVSSDALTRPGQLSSVVDMMTLESAAPGYGSTQLMSRLVEMVLILALRREAYSDSQRPGLRALTDTVLAPALQKIHAETGGDLSVSSLAAQCGLSRSAFAARFLAAAGQAPGAYVTDWRMTVAARILTTTDANIDRVALSVGYRSEAAFRRSFSTAMGCTPREYRVRRRSVAGEPRNPGAGR